MFTYDYLKGDTITLIVNNTLYLDFLMDDSLLKPIQYIENNVRIELWPSINYQEIDEKFQFIQIPKIDMVILIEYDCALPSVCVRRQTIDELHQCSRVELQIDDWIPNSSNIIPHHSIVEMEIDHDYTMTGSYNEVDCILVGGQFISLLSSMVEINNTCPLSSYARRSL